MDGVFMENGPYTFDVENDNIIHNPYNWNKHSNIVYGKIFHFFLIFKIEFLLIYIFIYIFFFFDTYILQLTNQLVLVIVTRIIMMFQGVKMPLVKILILSLDSFSEFSLNMKMLKFVYFFLFFFDKIK